MQAAAPDADERVLAFAGQSEPLLTSNIQRVSIPGNVLLEAGEANLPRQSVVEVSKVSTLEKSQLGDYIGTLDERRISQILAGMRFVQTSFGKP